MCGIWAIIGAEYVPAKHQREFLRIVGRGPDLSIISRVAPRVWLGFHRLAIVQPGDAPSGQPICADGLSVVCNGEIYNHQALKAQSPIDNELVRNEGSDCAAIVHAFRAAGNNLPHCCASLDGVFAFAMVDRQYLYLGRDPLGVRPLFYGFTPGQGLLIGSEAKAIVKLCSRVRFFPPGCCARVPLASASSAIAFADDDADPLLEHIQPYFQLSSGIQHGIGVFDAQAMLRKLLVEAVEKRLMGNRQFGFMLSGGLDSSLVAALATRCLRASGEPPPIAFSVGFEDSPDLENARRVAQHLGIAHRILQITPQDCIDVIPEVVYAMETFDPLVIRCGVAHYLLCKHIRTNTEVKVLLSGEGADELFGSYAYMQRAPNVHALHREIHRRLRLLHQYDVLRCDRCTSCHGLEIRVPFLDKQFIAFAARLPPSYKLIPNKTEKYILRSAFQGLLPEEVLWRSKEGFSEALGKVDLGEVLEEHARQLIRDAHFDNRVRLFPSQTPQTKEEFWYRSLFEQRFDVRKLDSELVHTKVYRTAAWQLVESGASISDSSPSGSISEEGDADEEGEESSKENRKPDDPEEKKAEMPEGEGAEEQRTAPTGAAKAERRRIRRRSTGSSKLAGVA